MPFLFAGNSPTRSHQACACSLSSRIKQNMNSIKLESRGAPAELGLPQHMWVSAPPIHLASGLPRTASQPLKEQYGRADIIVHSGERLVAFGTYEGPAQLEQQHTRCQQLNALQRQLQLARLHTATVIASYHNLQQAAGLLASHCLLCAGLGGHLLLRRPSGPAAAAARSPPLPTPSRQASLTKKLSTRSVVSQHTHKQQLGRVS